MQNNISWYQRIKSINDFALLWACKLLHSTKLNKQRKNWITGSQFASSDGSKYYPVPSLWNFLWNKFHDDDMSRKFAVEWNRFVSFLMRLWEILFTRRTFTRIFEFFGINTNKSFNVKPIKSNSLAISSKTFSSN